MSEDSDAFEPEFIVPSANHLLQTLDEAEWRERTQEEEQRRREQAEREAAAKAKAEADARAQAQAEAEAAAKAKAEADAAAAKAKADAAAARAKAREEQEKDKKGRGKKKGGGKKKGSGGAGGESKEKEQAETTSYELQLRNRRITMLLLDVITKTPDERRKYQILLDIPPRGGVQLKKFDGEEGGKLPQQYFGTYVRKADNTKKLKANWFQIVYRDSGGVKVQSIEDAAVETLNEDGEPEISVLGVQACAPDKIVHGESVGNPFLEDGGLIDDKHSRLGQYEPLYCIFKILKDGKIHDVV